MPTLSKSPHPPAGARATRRSLDEAFATFAEAAELLESSYAQLQGELARLNGKLEQKNRDLGRSLEENARMHAYLGRILEGLPCGVVVLEGGAGLRLANPQARRLLGMDSLDRFPEALRQILPAADESDSDLEVESAEGARFLAVRAARTPDGDTILILRDTTDEKRREAEREAARRTEALAEMSTLLAHEIRNPLGSLELFAGLLADVTHDHAEARQWVDHLQAGLRALSATVNNVLQFHSEPPPERLEINLAGLLEETVGFLCPLARQRALEIVFERFSTEIPMLADPHRLQQVFLNLALNAFRAMSPGGTLRVAVGRIADAAGDRVEVQFEDQGVGIAPENLGRIFEPGFTTHAGSPGLGLAVTKKIIEQHGGAVHVVSVTGRGAIFILSFPLPGGMG